MKENTVDPLALSDEELFKKARYYGANALEWRRKFIGLLPEIYKRKIYIKRGFSSVFEFAAKMGGVSHEQVRRTLNLAKKFENFPHLHRALVTGGVSMNKLARVASIASLENDGELVEACMQMPQAAVEMWVRDLKTENGLLELNSEYESVRAHTFFALDLNSQVIAKLQELANKGIDLNEMLLELLEKREEEIELEKEKIATELREAKSRYIPMKIKRLVQKEHGTRCSIPTCYKESVHLHHTQTFSLSKRHDPRYLAPLCKSHHDIAHAVNLKVQVKRREALRL
jgi:hypothetical protein